MTIKIVAPRISDSARNLAGYLRDDGGTRSWYGRLDNVNRGLHSPADLTINWGCGSIGAFEGTVHGGIALNHNTSGATNKLVALGAMADQGIPVPDFTNNIETARQWVAQGHRVYCRTQLRGHSGEDIVMADGDNPPVPAPLYTKEFIKRHEFRFHVVGNEVIDGVRKGFNSDIPAEERDRTIMNHAAGTTFFRSGAALERAQRDTQMLRASVRAVRALGLDFGAVDVMVDNNGNYSILEVNTAPGLEATTLVRYGTAFKDIHDETIVTPWSLQPLNPTQETNNMQTLTTDLIGNNISILQGRSVTVNRNFTGSTLTRGQHYQVINAVRTNSGSSVITLRKDTGSTQRYTVRNQFDVNDNVVASLQGTEGSAMRTPTPPVAPEVPQPQLPPANNDRTLPSTSPLRCVALSDGSLVNIGGCVRFQGESSQLNNGQIYTVADIRFGEESNLAFIGINVQGRGLRRWNASNFQEGTRLASVEPTPEAPQATEEPQAPTVTDSRGTNLVVGDLVRIVTRNGGHGFTVGGHKTIRAINSDDTLSLQGSNRRIRPTRVAKISQGQAQQEQALDEQANRQTAIQVGTRSYHIRERDLQSVQAFVASLTI